MIKLVDVFKAWNRIREYVRYTPLEYSHYYSKTIDGEVYLKLENLQVTGSFKVRGAFNKVLSLTKEALGEYVVTASAGNHGKALAYVSNLLGIKAIIFVPSNAPRNKIEGIKLWGADVVVCKGYYEDAEEKAKRYSREKGFTFISPYNDEMIIAGQGTIAIEILSENPDIEYILVPVGGGGLISGIAFTAKSINPEIKVIGVQSEASPVMYESIKRGRIVRVELKPSIAEGLHGQIEESSITFDYISRYVDDILLVNEDDIKNSIYEAFKYHRLVVEGAGAVGLSALEKYENRFRDRKVAVVLSGGNIDFKLFRDIVCAY